MGRRKQRSRFLLAEYREYVAMAEPQVKSKKTVDDRLHSIAPRALFELVGRLGTDAVMAMLGGEAVIGCAVRPTLESFEAYHEYLKEYERTQY